MKFIIKEREYGKPKSYALLAETEFEKTFLKEELFNIYDDKNKVGLRPSWGEGNELILEICDIKDSIPKE